MSLVVEADASDDGHIAGLKRAQELLNSLGLAGRRGAEDIGTLENLHLQLALAGKVPDIQDCATFGDYGVAIADVGGTLRDVTDQPVPRDES